MWHIQFYVTLQAIFMEDFVSVNLSKDEDKTWVPPEFILQLKPQQGLSQEEIHATTNLHIKFCPMYPHLVPVFQVENSHGISSKDVDKLQCELEELCKSREGEEVVFLMAAHTQAFLAERNQKPRFRSFHDEMLAIERKRVERFAEEEKSRRVKEDEQQLIAFEEEIQKKQPARLNELRRSKALDAMRHPLLEIKFAPSTRTSSCDRNERRNSNGPDSPPSETPACSRHANIKQITFSNKDGGRVYHIGSCMGPCQTDRYVCSAVEVNLKESAIITTLRVKYSSVKRRKC